MLRHTEIAIIGGGIYGASIAFHLAKLGKRDVLLLDKGPIGAETSSQGAGFLTSVRETEALTRLSLYSMEFYANFERETGSALALHRVGSVKVAHTDARIAELKLEQAVAQRVGVDVHDLSVSQLKKLAPILETTGVKAAHYVPFEGYLERTAQAVHGLARGAHQLGVTVQSHTPVTGLSQENGQGFILTTPQGEIQAEIVVLAAGAVGHLLASQLGVSFPAYPVQHNCVAVSTREAIPSDMPNLRLPDHDLYVRHDEGGLLIGGVEPALTSPAPSATWAELELAQVWPNREALAAFLNQAQALIPAAKESFVVREQRGLPMLTPDLNMALGTVPHVPGLYLANGCGMRGIQTGPGVGRLLAELIVQNESWIDPTPWRVDRFGDRFQDLATLRQASMAALNKGFLASQPVKLTQE